MASEIGDISLIAAFRLALIVKDFKKWTVGATTHTVMFP